MKTKYKKIKNRIFVGLGATATIVAPVASSVSFSVTPTTNSDFKNFIKAWKNFKNTAPIDRGIAAKVLETDFYKRHLRPFEFDSNATCWRIRNSKEMDAVIADLAKTKNLDNDKYAIADLIMEAQAYTDFIDYMGFDVNASANYSDIFATWEHMTNLTDSSIIPRSVSMGKTGYQKEYHVGKSDRGNDRVYDISSGDILKYFVATSYVSEKFDNLFSIMYYYQKKPLDSGNKYESSFSETLISLIEKWNTAVDEFWKIINPKNIELTFLKSLQDFSYIEKIDNSAQTEEQAYKNILKMNIVKKQYSSSAIQDMEKTIDEKTTTEKSRAFYEVILKISNNLKSFKQKAVNFLKINASETSAFSAIKQLTGNIEKPSSLISNEAFECVWSFAKLLLNYSKYGNENVEIRISDNPFTELGIRVRSGHNKLSSWNSIENEQLKTQFVNYSPDSELIASYQNVHSLNSFMPTQEIHKSDLKKYTIASIAVTKGEVMRTDYAIYFSMKLRIGNDFFKPKLILYENDHDDNNALKNIKETRYEGALQDFVSIGGPIISLIGTPITLTAGVAITLAGVVPGLIEGSGDVVIWRPGPSNSKTYDLTDDNHQPFVFLNFWRKQWLDDESPDDAIKFTEMEKELENLFTREWEHWRTKAINKKTWDPSSTYEFVLSIHSIEFPEVRFNTYNDDGWDDTHSDNFRFNNVKIFYDFKVIEKID